MSKILPLLQEFRRNTVEIKVSLMENNETTQANLKDVRRESLKNLFDFVEMFAIAACAILLIFTFFTRLTVVEGDSMDYTLQNGQRLLISDLFYTPKTGDIVVIQSNELPGELAGKAIVKRVIATEGETVVIKWDGVYVYDAEGNGGKLDELDGSLGYTVVPCTYAPYSITVGEGEVFVMGDNRPISLDSRAFGCVDARAIIGKAYFRISPLSEFGTID